MPEVQRPKKVELTPWEQHVQSWKDCQRCDLCHTRKNVVLGKGQVPCEILLCGQGPGKSEDTRGIPFDGMAGAKLDEVIHNALCHLPQMPTMAWTNLVACIPIYGESTKDEEPSDHDIKSCTPRLEEFARIASPRLVVCVGSLSWGWIGDPRIADWKHRIKIPKTVRDGAEVDVPIVTIVHPSAILKAVPARQGMMQRKAEMTLRNAVEEFLT